MNYLKPKPGAEKLIKAICDHRRHQLKFYGPVTIKDRFKLAYLFIKYKLLKILWHAKQL